MIMSMKLPYGNGVFIYNGHVISWTLSFAQIHYSPKFTLPQYEFYDEFYFTTNSFRRNFLMTNFILRRFLYDEFFSTKFLYEELFFRRILPKPCIVTII